MLAVIDDRPFKADLDSKQADEQKAESASRSPSYARPPADTAHRATPSRSRTSTTPRRPSTRPRRRSPARRRPSKLSRLNLEWCNVLSPIDGRVSNKLVTVGNLVNGGAGQATLLTTVQSVTPIYCYVDVDEHSVLKYQKLAAEGKLAQRSRWQSALLRRSSATKRASRTKASSTSSTTTSIPTTGTMRVRGVLKNQTGCSTPGFFAA